MSDVQKFFKQQHGYATMKELKENGVHPQTVQALLKRGMIEKLKPGLYKLSDIPVISEQGMIDVCMAMPKAIVCLHSALSYYELTTTLPSKIMIALPRGSKTVKLYYPPIQSFILTDKMYKPGIVQVKTENGYFKIYDKEKTVIDCFRFRIRIGEDVALEGLKNYFQSDRINIKKLLEYAQITRITTVIQPYIKALI